MEFRILAYFFFFNIFFAFILFGISKLVSVKADDRQKLSAYECGFEPFQDGSISFNIHYFLVAILFIIFDVEIVLLFPFVINFSLHSLVSFSYISCFLLMLTWGFLLEYSQKVLKW